MFGRVVARGGSRVWPGWGALLVCLLWMGCSGGGDPDWGFADVDAAMQPLREDFEAGYGNVRVVAVVSPTCGSCLDNCEQLYNSVDWFIENDVEVLFVWGAPMPTDTHIRCQQAVDRYPSDHIQHFYDNTGRTTRAFGRMLGVEGAQNLYDVFFVYGKDATWDPQGTMDTEPKDFSIAKTLWAPGVPQVLYSGNVNRIALKSFTMVSMMESIQPLLR